MELLPHLVLQRTDYVLPRKKARGGKTPERNHYTHSRTLRDQLDVTMSEFTTRQRPQGIDPHLIMRIQLHPGGNIEEDVWERSELTLLSIDKDKTLVLFANDTELREFKQKLQAYIDRPVGIRIPRTLHTYTSLFAPISEIGEVQPVDRIGPLFRSEGYNDPNQFENARVYSVDIEIWDFGSRTLNRERVDNLRGFILNNGGAILDKYIGDSLVLVRARCSGELLKSLLQVEYIASIDLPPKPSLDITEMLQLGVQDFPTPNQPAEDSKSIAILDSGITAGHELLAPAIGEATYFPPTIGTASDAYGHGTMVSGIAIYGDVEACIIQRSFVPEVVLYSARVLNDEGRFDDEKLIVNQMSDAIKYFYDNYHCRIFNLSLNEIHLIYDNGKIHPWATILDDLSRTLDVVIVVSAGNYTYEPHPDEPRDTRLTGYPRYLLNDEARIITPGTGAIVLTVGSLAQSADLTDNAMAETAALQPIARRNQPSPFTRRGPGIKNSVKPELCEYGGNWIYKGEAQQIISQAESSIISTNHHYLDSLFNTSNGTSFAAPRVAHYAAMLLRAFPQASANLIRALLASSASIPAEALDILKPIDITAPLKICGYGKPNLEFALHSDYSRVVLYSESELDLDNFHIYEVPIPYDFIQEKGTREISVVLAFDPPVRHTRIDYLGTKMSFRLIRGRSVDDVAAAFKKLSTEEIPVDSLSGSKFDCPMKPGANDRDGGTLQKGILTIKQPNEDYGATYYLVVRCEKKWSQEEHNPQRYAVVVSISHSAEINLYATIQQSVQATIRARARQ